MKGGLEFLDQLDAEAVDWLFTTGTEVACAQGQQLVERGKPGEALFVILSGVAVVSINQDETGRIADLGPGDIVGEMSFLEETPSSASVVAREPLSALRIDIATLRAKLSKDAAFGQVFFRAFARMLSARFRSREAAWLAAQPQRESDPVAQLWAKVEPVLAEFKQLVQQADQQAIKHDAVSAELAGRIGQAFARCERFMNDMLGDAALASEPTKSAVGARVQAEFLPYLLISKNAERWYSKPRGYAGDFLTISLIYENEARGAGRVGPILDRCFLDTAAVRAVQNRRALLVKEIHATLAGVPAGERARVTSLACGPAQELFDVYETLPDPVVLRSTLIDIDLQALAHVADRRDRKKLKNYMHLLNENLVYLAAGRRPVAIADQDFIYSIGLIDYFTDSFVIKLMDFIHGALRPGGRVVLGNFHPHNVTKAFMDHVLDWKIIHRTEQDMDRLYSASAFGRPCTRVLVEEQGINLFAECVK